MTMDLLRWNGLPQLGGIAVPTTDIWTEGSQLFVRVQLHGFGKEDVSVALESGDLVIRAHHQESEKDEKKTYIVRESTNSFVRRIRLPEFAKPEEISAAFEKGVLTVTIPAGTVPDSTPIPISGS